MHGMVIKSGVIEMHTYTHTHTTKYSVYPLKIICKTSGRERQEKNRDERIIFYTSTNSVCT